MEIKKILLEVGEYYDEVYEKDTIVYHHTAGGHRPDWVVNGWEHDKTKAGDKLKVATAYVIGGISTRPPHESDWDGVIVNTFDDRKWAHHLGCTTANNTLLNKKSIGIEICSYGPLVKGKDGNFYNYVNTQVPKEMVCELPRPFRNYTHYQRYTDKQLQALKELTLDIAARHPKIDIKKGILQFISQAGSFEVNQAALKGIGGIWSHSNYRSDKYDVFCQPELIEMIKTF
jgi:hypothetical protein